MHTADWHLGKLLQTKSRLPEQKLVMDEIVRIADEEDVHLVLMAGDVFDTYNPSAAAEELYYETLAKLSRGGERPIVVIAGNHDMPERMAAAHPLVRDQRIVLLGYPTEQVVEIETATGEVAVIAALPYPSEGRLRQLLSEETDEVLLRAEYDQKVEQIFATLAQSFRDDTVNLAMSHIYTRGGKMSDSERDVSVGGAYTVSAASLPEKAQYVALGHLHRPQQVGGAKTIARYSGSPLAYSFSEIGYAKSVTIVDVAPGETATYRDVYLSAGKPLVQWKVTSLDELYTYLEEERDQEAWVDLELTLTDTLSQEQIQRIRTSHPGIVDIRLNFAKTEEELAALQERRQLPIDEMFSRYYMKQTNGAMPEQAVLELFLELVAEEEVE